MGITAPSVRRRLVARTAPGVHSAAMWVRAVLLSLALAATASVLIASGAPSLSFAQSVPACDDGVDNDADGLVDWLEDPTCNLDPSATEGARPVCSDGVDNDQDGVADSADPGCRGRASGADETNPSPVPSRTRLTVARPLGCGIETGIEVLPDLAPARLFGFSRISIRVRGAGGRARGISVARTLPIGPDDGYHFSGLRPGRYAVSATYPGDPFRLPSAAAQRHVTLPASRCRVYVTGTGVRSYRPSIVYFGASARIFAIRWRRWGGPVAVGTGIFPANNCIPNCAEGSITDHPVTIRLSRRRLCNGYVQYLTMRFAFRGRRGGGNSNFGFRCR
jgi:hypothetical protein